jgi:TonB family protein
MTVRSARCWTPDHPAHEVIPDAYVAPRGQAPLDQLPHDVSTFLVAMHPRFHSHFTSYLESLEGLPIDAPLNLGAVVALIDIDLAADGSLSDVRVARASGFEAFDSAAMEAVRHGAPYPRPPPRVLRQGHVVVRWLFARPQVVGCNALAAQIVDR